MRPVTICAFTAFFCATMLLTNVLARMIDNKDRAITGLEWNPVCDPYCIHGGCTGKQDVCYGVCYCFGSGYEHRCSYHYGECDVVG